MKVFTGNKIGRSVQETSLSTAMKRGARKSAKVSVAKNELVKRTTLEKLMAQTAPTLNTTTNSIAKFNKSAALKRNKQKLTRAEAIAAAPIEDQLNRMFYYEPVIKEQSISKKSDNEKVKKRLTTKNTLSDAKKSIGSQICVNTCLLTIPAKSLQRQHKISKPCPKGLNSPTEKQLSALPQDLRTKVMAAELTKTPAPKERKFNKSVVTKSSAQQAIQNSTNLGNGLTTKKSTKLIYHKVKGAHKSVGVEQKEKFVKMSSTAVAMETSGVKKSSTAVAMETSGVKKRITKKLGPGKHSAEEICDQQPQDVPTKKRKYNHDQFSSVSKKNKAKKEFKLNGMKAGCTDSCAVPKSRAIHVPGPAVAKSVTPEMLLTEKRRTCKSGSRTTVTLSTVTDPTVACEVASVTADGSVTLGTANKTSPVKIVKKNKKIVSKEKMILSNKTVQISKTGKKSFNRPNTQKSKFESNGSRTKPKPKAKKPKPSVTSFLLPPGNVHWLCYILLPPGNVH